MNVLTCMRVSLNRPYSVILCDEVEKAHPQVIAALHTCADLCSLCSVIVSSACSSLISHFLTPNNTCA